MNIGAIYEKILCDHRITEGEALSLSESASLLELSRLATIVRNRKNHPGRVSYVIDRNVNYTNICNIRCTFCAFHRDHGDSDSYVLDHKTLEQKASETKKLGGTGILLQGGINTELSWDYYLDMVSFLHDQCNIWVHGFSPVEIQHMAKLSGLGLEATLHALMKAGLGSLPGGGAEILVDSSKHKIAPDKGGVSGWLEVMEIAHSIGLPTTATMMFGITETIADRIEHFAVIRNQQDRALANNNGGAFTAFAAWPFQSGNTTWDGKIPSVTDTEYLRNIAVARIFLDNFPHIQASWVTMGKKTGQMALHYGCDDIGSLMIEENVVSAAGTRYRVNRDEIERMIVQAGFEPWQRDNIYRAV